MAPSKINIKDRLTDGEIDLSMSDLQEVPVRDIAVYKKAHSLDLSNNHLKKLAHNFSTLNHLTKLDLSNNQIVELPDNFGDLVKLKYLDLYQNKLQNLPVSFYKLKALRWLDLKDNPLETAIRRVAGPCADSKQCQSCAKDVVDFYTQVHERIQIDLEALKRQAGQSIQMEKKVKAKKVEKTAPKKSNGPSKPQQQQKKSKKSVPVKAKKPSSFCKLLCLTLISSLLVVFVLTSIKCQHTQFIEDGVVYWYGRGLSQLPPQYQVYLKTVEPFVKNVHDKTGNYTLIAVEYAKDKENYVRAYNFVQERVQLGVDTAKELYKKYVS